MSKVSLRVRDLETGVERNVELDNVDAARQWLVQRPRSVEALGVASELDRETSLALKAAMRPLDEAELRLQRELDAAAEALRAKREREGKAAELAAAEAHRTAAREADPNRPMQIRYRFDDGIKVAEHLDERPISDAAREAVDAWIAERNEWVSDRGQIVGEATVTVWPNAVPADSDRILHGTFIPVTGPSPESKPN